MTSSTTARLLAEDLERARLIGAVQNQGHQEVIHEALLEYVANHRDVLQGQFQQVQRAVLAGDRESLREVLRAGAAQSSEAHLAAIADAWGD